MQAFLSQAWEPSFLAHDANDLLAMLTTWQAADISNDQRFDRDFFRALQAITAKAIIMPCRTDLYFPLEDSELEVALLPNAELRAIPSVWDRMAGGGVNPDNAAFVDAALKVLLAA